MQDNFAPVMVEHEDQPLEIMGALPAGLRGTLLRNGPNPQFPPAEGYHWFDGDGMIHGVELNENGARYRNRWVRTPFFSKEQTEGRSMCPGSLVDPGFDRSPADRNKANTAIVHHAGKTFALWEGGAPTGVDPGDLSTLGQEDFEGRLRSPFTAHPRICPRSGELFFFGASPTPPFLQFGVLDPTGQLVRQFPIELDSAGILHDFAITEKHVVFLDLPTRLRLERALQGKSPLTWEPERGTRVGVMRRDATSADLRWFEFPPCFMFHIANAYESGHELSISFCRMSASTIVGAEVDLGELAADANKPRLHEFVLNMNTGQTRERPLDDRLSEFPRVAASLTGIRHRYIYAARTAGEKGLGTVLFSGVLKYDDTKQQIEEHRFEDGTYGGEFLFVPAPGGAQEDDGWLLGFVHDTRKNRSELRVLDARRLDAPALARMPLPQRVPYGFHAEWIAHTG